MAQPQGIERETALALCVQIEYIALALEMLNYVFNVTYPRSGHTLLWRCLRAYLRERLHYCEHYTHCRRVPCLDARTTWQKSHDFRLELPIVQDAMYVIQYRHPLESVTSWYLWELDQGIRAEDSGLPLADILSSSYHWKRLSEFVTPDSPRRWRRFMFEKLQFWQLFVHRWVFGDVPNRHLLNYRDFITQGETSLARMLRVGWPEEELDEGLVARVVDGHKFVLRNKLPAFRYYDPEFFQLAERTVLPELERLSIEPIFQ